MFQLENFVIKFNNILNRIVFGIDKQRLTIQIFIYSLDECNFILGKFVERVREWECVCVLSADQWCSNMSLA